MIKLTENHLALFNKVSARGIGRSCNDLNRNEEDLLSATEWRDLTKAYHAWNGDPEEFEERTNYVLMDFQVTAFIQAILIEFYKTQSLLLR